MNDVDAAITRAVRPERAQTVGVDAEWSAVLTAADVDARGGRRVLLLAAAILAAVLLALPALGLADDILEFVEGDPAPAPVKKEVAQLEAVKGELIPLARRDPGLLVDRTYLARGLVTSQGKAAYLWVTPRKDRGFCEHLQLVGNELPNGRPNLSGGCSSGPPRRKLAASVGTTRVGNGYVTLVRGRVSAGTHSLTLVLDDGSQLPVRIATGFFLEEVPAGRRAEELVAFDADRSESARQSLGALLPTQGRPPTERQITGPARVAAQIATSQGVPAKLEIVPTIHGTCLRLRFRGSLSGTCGRRPERPIDVTTTQIGSAPDGVFLLAGPVAPRVSNVELRYEDGDSEPLPIVDGLVLHEVLPDRFTEGRRPIELVARDRMGRRVGIRKLGPWARG